LWVTSANWEQRPGQVPATWTVTGIGEPTPISTWAYSTVTGCRLLSDASSVGSSTGSVAGGVATSTVSTGWPGAPGSSVAVSLSVIIRLQPESNRMAVRDNSRIAYRF